jgi:hypothetical protein
MEQRFLGDDDQPDFLPRTAPTRYRFDALTAALYSRELCNLVEACLNVEPINRPSITALRTQIAGKLSSDAWAVDRNGGIRPGDDTLLPPNHPVRLKWASRMNAGPAGVNAARVARRRDSDTSTVYDPDPESDTRMTGT